MSFLPDFDGESIAKSGHFLDSIVTLFNVESGSVNWQCVRRTTRRDAWNVNVVVALHDVTRDHPMYMFCVLLPSHAELCRHTVC